MQVHTGGSSSLCRDGHFAHPSVQQAAQGRWHGGGHQWSFGCLGGCLGD